MPIQQYLMHAATSNTIAPTCADRSGGPAMKPKPGDSYETGADRAGGRPWGPDEADGWPWRRTADPGLGRVRGHAVESWQVTTSPEMRWKAHI